MKTLIPAILIAFLRSPQEPSGDGYSFFKDGKPWIPYFDSMTADSKTRAPGDVVFVDDLPIVLGESGVWRFRTTKDRDGRVFRVDEAGKESVIGVNLTSHYNDNQKVFDDPLSPLTDDEIRGLRGVRLNCWPEGIEKKLALLNPARAALWVTDAVQQKGSLPELPPGIRYLYVDESSNSGIRNFQSLEAQRDLQVFYGSLMTADSFDLNWLKNSTGLKLFTLRYTKLAHADAMAAFKDMRNVILGGQKDIKSIEWARGMKSLVSLNLRETGVEDLSPLDELSSLVMVNANHAPIRKLPQGPLPALKELDIQSTKISDVDAEAFRRAHPGCEVRHRWAAALRHGLASANRLRVRTGGTCHTDPETEKTLLDLRDAAAIQTFLGGVEVDEAQSGFHCMCCGYPTLEFYEGEKLVGIVGMHHGRSLRWPGEWPGDALLTAGSIEFLVEWLAKHGVEQPKKDFDEGRRRKAALSRRWDRVRAILPPVTWGQLESAKSREDAEKALEEVDGTALDRAKLFLRLYGSHDGSWNLDAGFDSIVKSAFSKVDEKTFSEAVVAMLDHPEGAMGAARMVLYEGRGEQLTADVRAKALPILARIGLSHSRDINRQHTFQTLVALKDSAAVPALKEVLAGTLKPRELRKDDEVEPGGSVTYGPGDKDVPEDVSDAAYAAYALARIGDRSMIEEIRALHAKAGPNDVALLDLTLRLLEKPK
jgi:hypothetical protein